MCEQPLPTPLTAAQREPDDQDYEYAAEDCLTQVGLGQVAGATAYDSYRRSFGFKARTPVGSIEGDYLSGENADRLRRVVSEQGVDRELLFEAVQHRSSDVVDQLWSTTLDDGEYAAAIEQIRTGEDCEFAENQLEYWMRGDPEGLDKCFGLGSPASMWKRIGRDVAAASPTARQRLELAEGLSEAAREDWQAQCDYIGSDDWRTDQAEIEQELQ